MRTTYLNMIHFVAIYLYHIVGKFGKVFNLAIWQSRRKTIKFNSTNIKPHGTSQLVIVLLEIYLYTLQRMQCWVFFSLSGKEIRVANKCMRHALNHDPTCSQTVSPRSQAHYCEYTPEGRAKM